LPTSAVEQVFRVLLRLVDDDIPPSIPILLDAAELLRSAGAEASLVDEYRARCKKRVPLAWVFASDEQKAKRAAERESQILPNGKADV